MSRQLRPSSPTRALRLTLEYEGRTVSVVSREHLAKVTPPSHALSGYERHSGFWYELQDAKGQVLYRRIRDNPIRVDVEAYDPEGGPRRYPVKRPRGIFVVLVPDLPKADALVLMSSPLDPRRKLESAQPLAKIPLRERPGAR